jgi:hypothetical protein
MQVVKLQAWSQQAITWQVPQLQSQGSQLQGGAQSQGLAFAAVQQQGPQHQQGTQELVPNQQMAMPSHQHAQECQPMMPEWLACHRPMLSWKVQQISFHCILRFHETGYSHLHSCIRIHPSTRFYGYARILN